MKHSDLIFDVGMHRGEDTAFYLARGFRVVGFEADPVLAQGCRERFRDAIDSGRLTLVEGAICSNAAERGSVTFYRNTRSSVWGTISAEMAERNRRQGAYSEAVNVVAIDFAAWLHAHGVPHYLKIDIEGADMICLDALAGMSERPDYLSVESDKTDFDALIREFDLLYGLGYRRFAAVQQAVVETPPYVGLALDGTPIRHAFERGCSGRFGVDLQPLYVSREQAIEIYRKIFWRYRWFGDESPLKSIPGGRIVLKAADKLSRITRGERMPGWYDTHASLT